MSVAAWDMTYNLISVWIPNVTDGYAGSMYICRQENDSLSGNTDQNGTNETGRNCNRRIADIQLAERNQL